jgi:hypothetical protein
MDAELPTVLLLPLMVAELAIASWETMARRSLMMILGTCTRTEYQRMLLEKVSATQRTLLLLSQPWDGLDVTTLLGLWHEEAAANARRLRQQTPIR